MSWTTTNSRSWPRIERIRAELGQRHRRVGGGDPQEPDRALLGVAEDLHRVRRRRVVRDLASARRSRARASSATCASLDQLRKPGRSPSAPHSRVFCAVGWPFICRTPQPGLPSMPRTMWMLLTCDGGGRGLMRLVEALQHRRTAAARRCRAAAPPRGSRSAGTSQISAARSGGYSATCVCSSSKPTVCAST